MINEPYTSQEIMSLFNAKFFSKEDARYYLGFDVSLKEKPLGLPLSVNEAINFFQLGIITKKEAQRQIKKVGQLRLKDQKL